MEQRVRVKGDLGLGEFQRAVAHAGVLVPSVSRWSVGMHVHHCCLAMTNVCRALRQSTPPPPRAGISPVRWLVFLTGWIPRGRGKAPDIALPSETISPPELERMLGESERALSGVPDLDPQSWFSHFVFGPLNRDKTLRFLQIHNRHHLRIIADILAAA